MCLDVFSLALGSHKKPFTFYFRYRFIVVVTIGEKLMQGYYSLANFLWDADKDGYLSYVIDTPKFFAVATLYYLYYD